jgi:hypothetical protein
MAQVVLVFSVGIDTATRAQRVQVNQSKKILNVASVILSADTDVRYASWTDNPYARIAMHCDY